MRLLIIALLCIPFTYGESIAFLQDEAPPAKAESEWTGNLNLLIGRKSLGGDWRDELEQLTNVGLMMDFRKKTWPVSLVFDWTIGTTDYEASDSNGSLLIREFDIGVRKYLVSDEGAFFYLGGGLAFASADLEIRVPGESFSESESETGLWGGIGGGFTINKACNLFVDLRASTPEYEDEYATLPFGGTSMHVGIGFHW